MTWFIYNHLRNLALDKRWCNIYHLGHLICHLRVSYHFVISILSCTVCHYDLCVYHWFSKCSLLTSLYRNTVGYRYRTDRLHNLIYRAVDSPGTRKYPSQDRFICVCASDRHHYIRYERCTGCHKKKDTVTLSHNFRFNYLNSIFQAGMWC